MVGSDVLAVGDAGVGLYCVEQPRHLLGEPDIFICETDFVSSWPLALLIEKPTPPIVRLSPCSHPQWAAGAQNSLPDRFHRTSLLGTALIRGGEPPFLRSFENKGQSLGLTKKPKCRPHVALSRCWPDRCQSRGRTQSLRHPVKTLNNNNWLWLVAGTVPSLTGMLLLLLVGPDGGPGTLALFLAVNATGSAAFGIGVAKIAKSIGPRQIVMGLFSGIAAFIISAVFLVIAGATMFGL